MPPVPTQTAWRVGLAVLLATGAAAAVPDAASLAAQHCVPCHNQNLVGSPAPNLLDGLTLYGSSDESLVKSIRQGYPQSGMPGFAGILSEPEIQALVAYIRKLQPEYAAGRIQHVTPPRSLHFTSERHGFTLETFIDGLETPWGIQFLPDGRMLVTEREGRLRVIAHGRLDPQPVRGTPRAYVRTDGGLLDVIAHPDYAKNGWLYLAYSELSPAGDRSMTVVVRGRIRDGHWVESTEIFRAPPRLYYPGAVHYGCRFLFDREHRLFFTLGDRGKPEDAQDLTSPLGKIHRVTDDGRVPRDNPFADRAGAWPSIWCYGNRHAQGLAWHPVTGRLWATEHGPTGGDELNRIEPGRNYGWPLVSLGTDRLLRFSPARPGLEPPRAWWSPSVAPAGMEFYTGDKFPQWRNSLFIACLGGEQLKRIETDGDEVTHQEIVFRGYGRVRDVVTGPDGLIYLAINTPGRIARLVPAANTPSPAAAK